MEEVIIENGVESIGDSCFEECGQLKTIYIPASVKEIEEYAFYDCDNVTIVTTAGSYAETYANENGIPCEIQ